MSPDESKSATFAVSYRKQAERGFPSTSMSGEIRATGGGPRRRVERQTSLVDGGESAKSLNRRHGSASGAVDSVGAGPYRAKLDRLTRASRTCCTLLERFERPGRGLWSVAESLDTGFAAGAAGAEHHDCGEPVGARGDR